eukprot:1931510-Pleurochrysis_carterae.AAC.2
MPEGLCLSQTVGVQKQGWGRRKLDGAHSAQMQRQSPEMDNFQRLGECTIVSSSGIDATGNKDY